jgi:CBS domain-containing protein
MTPVAEMYGVRPESTLDEAMAIVSGMKVRHLPVFNGHSVVGLISIGDVLKSLIADKDIQIEHLSSYIAGRYV